MIMVVNNLSVFVPAQIAQGIIVQKGDRILVYGLVQTYRGKKEIVVNSAGDIRPLVTENSTG
jgi:DNA/RNA endonuclease YhcR with UshA esterase domain